MTENTLKIDENFLGKEEVTSSNLVIGSTDGKGLAKASPFFYAYWVTYRYLIANFLPPLQILSFLSSQILTYLLITQLYWAVTRYYIRDVKWLKRNWTSA